MAETHNARLQVRLPGLHKFPGIRTGAHRLWKFTECIYTYSLVLNSVSKIKFIMPRLKVTISIVVFTTIITVYYADI
jgi:hypothetical protein